MPTNPKRALLVIDVQNVITGKPPISYPARSFGNVLNAMDAANCDEP